MWPTRENTPKTCDLLVVAKRRFSYSLINYRDILGQSKSFKRSFRSNIPSQILNLSIEVIVFPSVITSSIFPDCIIHISVHNHIIKSLSVINKEQNSHIRMISIMHLFLIKKRKNYEERTDI